MIEPLLLLLCCTLQNEPPPALPSSIQVAGVRKVMAAIVKAGEQNQRRPEGPRKGDALADWYLRQAMQAALKEKTSPQEMLVALGIALDTTHVLRNHPVCKPILLMFESDAERKHRLKVLGAPTMKGRTDWLLHFTISAGLTAALDAEAAEHAGIFKEVLDSKGGSGFSFADLAADYAGIRFAQHLLQPPQESAAKLTRWSKDFRVAAWLPSMDGFEEGLTWTQMQKRFGDLADPRFRKACEKVRDEVDKVSLP